MDVEISVKVQLFHTAVCSRRKHFEIAGDYVCKVSTTISFPNFSNFLTFLLIKLL